MEGIKDGREGETKEGIKEGIKGIGRKFEFTST